uniref:T9SS type A sorting domain-containing protein n=1 Tax=Lewinella cohaerens TaxID=70995 RepID=UPI0005C70732
LHITGAGDANITGGVVSGNTATAEGGGLWNGAGTMTVTEVSIMNNTATGGGSDQGGGGVFNAGGTVEIVASTIANNMVDGSGAGGGVHNDAAGTMNVTYSTISGNTGTQAGGGLANNGSLTVTASTVTNNTAQTEGGGFFQSTASSSTMMNSTLVAGNFTGTTGVDVAGMGSIGSMGYNLIGIDDSGAFTAMMTDTVGTEVQPVDANLDVLADNGGSTMTHALQCPSPAIDGGDPDNNEADQRNLMVFNDRRDIGAFEYQEECITAVRDVVKLEGSSIYPNPAVAGFAWLEIPESFGEEVVVRISAMGSGQLLKTKQFNTTGTVRLDLSGLPAGMYQVQLFAKGGVVSHKLITTK